MTAKHCIRFWFYYERKSLFKWVSGSISPWWHYQMETFSALLAICVGNSLVNSEFPTQRPMTWSFDVFFDLRLNKRLSKQSWGWWFEMPWCPIWHHCNAVPIKQDMLTNVTNCAHYSESPSITLRDDSVFAPSQWEMALHCNAISHWLGTYTESSLNVNQRISCHQFCCCLHSSGLRL